jgi:hypothetical protein
MRKILISYGDIRFKESLKRIRRQAIKSGLFDEVVIYSDKDLPGYIKSSPLMAFNRGGGYWVWKPYIIYHILNKCSEGDVVYYIDSGCTLNKSSDEWNEYQKYLELYNAIFFQYRSNYKYPGWENVCSKPENNSTEIIHWMKPSCVTYFDNYFQDKGYHHFDKIWGGFMIIKKTKPIISMIEDWYRITLFNPELIVDPFGKELTDLPESFNLHRHDQSIITPLIYHFKEKDKILVLPETSESSKQSAAVIASRYRVGKLPLWQYIKYKLYNFVHK